MKHEDFIKNVQSKAIKSFKQLRKSQNIDEIANEKALEIYASAADALESSIIKELKQLLNKDKQLGLAVYYIIADILDNREFGGERLYNISEDIEDFL